jgi:4-hydroxy-tetrahydrodipicolinate reductase
MTRAIRVVVNGASGRMGSLAVAALQEAEGIEFAGGCGRGDDLAAAIGAARADVVVDFTRPDCVRANALAIVDAGARPVVGTSGVDGATRGELAKRCEEKGIGGLLAPNFAIGAVLMMQFAQQAARHMARAEVIELHHDTKIDKPSGTAARTASLMQASSPRLGDVPVHSVRLPGLVAHQEVILGDVGQTLTIRHDSMDRESFMPGVLLAIRRVGRLPESPVVGLERLLAD